DLPDSMIALCDYLTPNESEAEALTGIAVTGPEDGRQAAEQLIARGAGSVIVTLGEKGALLVSKAGAVHVPAVSAGKVLDTTGAGDAFNGGFAVALARGLPPEDAVRFGCCVAGISVTRPGTAPAMPDLAEAEALFGRKLA
ncbi:MAG: bifunctional hydroxymethylpyrimidine kinase/phosphomethylpyrimidine kinase, partial [Alphaproteobacteria bacterium]|nr:bifunctional hydroxymethylpyrimidine kinase/phosphomethylpyrimidine kinase [Alphaproteobacteria bacterium]